METASAALPPVAAELQLRKGRRRHTRPRLSSFSYVGRFAYHVVLVTTLRQPVLVGRVADDCISVLKDASFATDFEALAYCVMPDHVHVLVQGQSDTADLFRFVQRFKQVSSYRFKHSNGVKLWQDSFYDRASRSDESLENAATYVFANPVTAGLTDVAAAWPYSGGELWNGTVESGAKASPLRESVLRSTDDRAPL